MDWRKSEHVFGTGEKGSARRADGSRRPSRGGRPRARPAGPSADGPNGARGSDEGASLPHGDRLDEIIATATHLIARAGYHKASMRQLAAATGVSLAGLYHYFPSKERLLFLIQFRAFSGLLTEVTAALNGVDEPVEQLRMLIHTHVQYVVRNMAALKVCSHELDSLTGDAHAELRRVRRRYYDMARGIVARVLNDARGQKSAVRCQRSEVDAEGLASDLRVPASGLDVRIATMSLFGTLNWLYRWYDPGPHGRDRTPAGLANQIFTQFLAGLVCTGPVAKTLDGASPC
jgi:TetR/AcrR family transcriptional regulator, cholesterol catabolism regulator